MCFWSWEYPAAELGLGVDVFSRWYLKADVICVGIYAKFYKTLPVHFSVARDGWLRSSLWLQFKPHHIAAGAAYLAAKILNLDVASYQYIWQEFQTTPAILQDVAQQLMELF
ncbi:Cyclin-T1-4 [Vitis vinifera]|uniref:Cyclin-T1-4 n=1 Tax=Vitis vinifera TaxID=29760 RepID=A0A438F6B6_VITVI|nr:Cyclin-T1-4 [Vitis vinifera]